MRADDGRVVSNVITQALAGEDITIYGNGDQTRSFCYVDDLVEGLARLAALGTPVCSAVNLGNPDELRVAELAERVRAITGSRSAVVQRPLPVDDPRRRRPDITLARLLLGWSPCVQLDLGLRSTIGWFAAELGCSTPSAAKPPDDALPMVGLSRPKPDALRDRPRTQERDPEHRSDLREA
jgi:UDP-glucuronate decarboxylase